MSYSDFTLHKLKQQFGLDHHIEQLFDTLIPIAPSQRLLDDIKEAEQYPLSTEKARTEYVIIPILKEVKRLNANDVTIFSGYALNILPKQGLKGNCDFILSNRTQIVDVSAPIFCLVEAKRGIIEDAFGQCGAEMYAAGLFNTSEKRPTDVIFGAVTNATEWIFMKLKHDEQTIIIDTTRYKINELDKILGMFQTIIDLY